MIATLVGILILLIALVDAFEAIILPRRITRRWRLARLYYRNAWRAWRSLCELLPPGRYRENTFSVFGPLSLLGLFTCWASLLIIGFGMLHRGWHTLPGENGDNIWECLYHSGETFFTLGYGDVTPATAAGKFLAVVEAGTGFGFMAIVIGYLPVLYQAFSRREQAIALLDARAGSPPTAGELLRRTGNIQSAGGGAELERFLIEWEAWAADLLESHLSFPVLSFYRSQHDNQSWLAALAVVLDVSSWIVVTREGCRRRAELTFAMARHACVDLCLIFWLPPVEGAVERLPDAELQRLLSESVAGPASAESSERIRRMRSLYDPFLHALAEYFRLRLPGFVPERSGPDNWQTTAWTPRAPGITELASGTTASEHFG